MKTAKPVFLLQSLKAKLLQEFSLRLYILKGFIYLVT